MTAQGAKRGRGRQPILSESGIADAALAVVADSSAGALTMQAVAARLGVRHSALSRHGAGRPELLRAVADRLVDRMDWPDPERFAGWREFLRATWSTLDGACARYPGLAEVVFSSVWPPPKRSIDGGLYVARALIERWGFSEPLALGAVDLVLDFTADARARIDRILAISPEWDGFGDALRDDPPELRASFEEHLDVGPRAWTLSKLEVILDGLDVRLRSL